jgi:hypothetical protein
MTAKKNAKFKMHYTFAYGVQKLVWVKALDYTREKIIQG